jgi:hypothetical protein
MFLARAAGPAGSRYAQGSNNVPHLTVLNRPSSLFDLRWPSAGERVASCTGTAILVCKLPQNLTRYCRCRYRGCAARRWRPRCWGSRRDAANGPFHGSTRLGGFDRPLTGTPARYGATSAARERRAHPEQPAAGTSRSTKTGGEPRARRPSGRQDRLAHHVALAICRAACFQESSRMPTTDARSMCRPVERPAPPPCSARGSILLSAPARSVLRTAVWRPFFRGYGLKW